MIREKGFFSLHFPQQLFSRGSAKNSRSGKKRHLKKVLIIMGSLKWASEGKIWKVTIKPLRSWTPGKRPSQFYSIPLCISWTQFTVKLLTECQVTHWSEDCSGIMKDFSTHWLVSILTVWFEKQFHMKSSVTTSAICTCTRFPLDTFFPLPEQQGLSFAIFLRKKIQKYAPQRLCLPWLTQLAVETQVSSSKDEENCVNVPWQLWKC